MANKDKNPIPVYDKQKKEWELDQINSITENQWDDKYVNDRAYPGKHEKIKYAHISIYDKKGSSFTAKPFYFYRIFDSEIDKLILEENSVVFLEDCYVKEITGTGSKLYIADGSVGWIHDITNTRIQFSGITSVVESDIKGQAQIENISGGSMIFMLDSKWSMKDHFLFNNISNCNIYLNNRQAFHTKGFDKAVFMSLTNSNVYISGSKLTTNIEAGCNQPPNESWIFNGLAGTNMTLVNSEIRNPEWHKGVFKGLANSNITSINGNYVSHAAGVYEGSDSSVIELNTYSMNCDGGHYYITNGTVVSINSILEGNPGDGAIFFTGKSEGTAALFIKNKFNWETPNYPFSQGNKVDAYFIECDITQASPQPVFKDKEVNFNFDTCNIINSSSEDVAKFNDSNITSLNSTWTATSKKVFNSTNTNLSSYKDTMTSNGDDTISINKGKIKLVESTISSSSSSGLTGSNLRAVFENSSITGNVDAVSLSDSYVTSYNDTKLTASSGKGLFVSNGVVKLDQTIISGNTGVELSSVDSEISSTTITGQSIGLSFSSGILDVNKSSITGTVGLNISNSVVNMYRGVNVSGQTVNIVSSSSDIKDSTITSTSNTFSGTKLNIENTTISGTIDDSNNFTSIIMSNLSGASMNLTNNFTEVYNSTVPDTVNITTDKLIWTSTDTNSLTLNSQTGEISNSTISDATITTVDIKITKDNITTLNITGSNVNITKSTVDNLTNTSGFVTLSEFTVNNANITSGFSFVGKSNITTLNHTGFLFQGSTSIGSLTQAEMHISSDSSAGNIGTGVTIFSKHTAPGITYDSGIYATDDFEQTLKSKFKLTVDGVTEYFLNDTFTVNVLADTTYNYMASVYENVTQDMAITITSGNLVSTVLTGNVVETITTGTWVKDVTAGTFAIVAGSTGNITAQCVTIPKLTSGSC